jgi:hypothetical protein
MQFHAQKQVMLSILEEYSSGVGVKPTTSAKEIKE